MTTQTAPQTTPDAKMKTEALPEHVLVFRSEADICKPGTKRRHAYYVYGSGSKHFQWSEVVDRPLAKTKWAPIGSEYPPTDGRYTVQICEDGKERSGPIVIDPALKTPRKNQKLLTWGEYKKADGLWRGKQRNIDVKKKRADAIQQQRQANQTGLMMSEMGARALSSLILETSRKARQKQKEQLEQPLNKAISSELEEHLKTIEQAAEMLANRTRR